MRSYKTEGIIIKRKNFGEADRILTVFTKKFGKIQIKAIGVRRIVSRRSSHIELLNYSQVTIYKGKSLPLLTEVETVNNFKDIKKELKKIGVAYHICELIDSLCPENQENEQVFELLRNILEKVSVSEETEDLIKNFEIKLLSILGFYNLLDGKVDNPSQIIEYLLEKKLKARQIMPHFS